MLDLIEINRNTETPNLLEMETLYANPPRKGTLLKLLWVKGEAVGFFILRLKGFPQLNIHQLLYCSNQYEIEIH